MIAKCGKSKNDIDITGLFVHDYLEMNPHILTPSMAKT